MDPNEIHLEDSDTAGGSGEDAEIAGPVLDSTSITDDQMDISAAMGFSSFGAQRKNRSNNEDTIAKAVDGQSSLPSESSPPARPSKRARTRDDPSTSFSVPSNTPPDSLSVAIAPIESTHTLPASSKELSQSNEGGMIAITNPARIILPSSSTSRQAPGGSGYVQTGNTGGTGAGSRAWTSARGDPVYWDPSFVEDPWAGLQPRRWEGR